MDALIFLPINQLSVFISDKLTNDEIYESTTNRSI